MLDQRLYDLFGSLFDLPPNSEGEFDPGLGFMISPILLKRETDSSVLVVPVPGIPKKEVKVHLKSNNVVVSRKQDEKVDILFVIDLRRLKDQVSETIEASLEDGMLRIKFTNLKPVSREVAIL